MKMRTCGASRRADERNRLAFLHSIAGLDEKFLIVRVARDVPVTVIDLDHSAISEAVFGVGDDASCDRHGL